MKKDVFPGASETTPSRAEYFSWINNTNEGATEKQTLANLDFFAFMRRTFGMRLDIYAFDAGAVDGAGFYGSTSSKRFEKHFPRSFRKIADRAAENGIRLGVWAGPDGFGITKQSALKRIDMMASLCRDFHFMLFKFDMVCGPLPPCHEKYFIAMMEKCRKYSPDLIALNHRIPLSKEGLAHMTTFLWEGRESYTDVHSFNEVTAPHHRAGALARGLVPGLKRLAEDHGVCLSSCLDNWDDELVIHAFGRSLLVSPEIYGNPWLLRDGELPKLARLFNLHKRFSSNLVNAKKLPESKYGIYAVSRGNSEHRFITLRNLSWTPEKITLSLPDIGISKKMKSVEVRAIHPCERCLGEFPSSGKVEVTVPPFRAVLVHAGLPLGDGLPCDGRCYNVIESGTGAAPRFVKVDGSPEIIAFSKLKRIPVPVDCDAIYEYAVFAADNNALEVRSLARAGKTKYPEVQKARDAFFGQKTFRDRMCSDGNIFCSNEETAFGISPVTLQRISLENCCFRLDFGRVVHVDEIVVKVRSGYELLPVYAGAGTRCEVSSDLKNWKTSYPEAGVLTHITVNDKIRYLKMPTFPIRITEVYALSGGRRISRAGWRANVLFRDRASFPAAYSGRIKFPEDVRKYSKLCVAVNGVHGEDAAFAVIRFEDGTLSGFPDRAPSFQCNPWEHFVISRDRNYTFILPVRKEYAGKRAEITVVCMNDVSLDVRPYLL